jgi:hypothetical protein
MRLPRRPSLAAIVPALTLHASDALAHGPCGCLDPMFYSEAIGQDAKITVNGPAYLAYKVIFNPRPRDVGIAPDDLRAHIGPTHRP